MDIRQLEAFVYTVKYQSFSLAAQKLYLSQPTVSSHINNLEKELHTQLLKRTTKSLSVTPAGQTLYNYAAEILNLQQKAILELSDKNQKLLHIGVSSVPSLYLLPELLSAYHQEMPDVRFRTSCSDSLDVIAVMDDAASLIRCITLGMGISILSRATVQNDAQLGKLLIIPLEQSAFLRKLYIVYSSTQFMSEPTAHFFAFMKQFYAIS